VKVGFIGTLERSPDVISSRAIKGDRFLEESKVANEAAARLERAGVHVKCGEAFTCARRDCPSRTGRREA